MLRSFNQKGKVATLTVITETHEQKQRAIALSILLGGTNGHQSDIKNSDAIRAILERIEDNCELLNMLDEIRIHLKNN